MKLQSTISRTKKRLSDESWAIATIAIGIVGLSFVLAFLVRIQTLPRPHGLVRADIPTLPIAVKDPAVTVAPELRESKITKATPTVALTFDAFYYGNLDAFAGGFYRQDNKFAVRHQDNQPQLGNLIRDLAKWLASSKSSNETVVLMPMSGIPMPIVLQVIEGLRHHAGFKHVVLTNGVI